VPDGSGLGGEGVAGVAAAGAGAACCACPVPSMSTPAKMAPNMVMVTNRFAISVYLLEEFGLPP